jgi:hypothetical protein
MNHSITQEDSAPPESALVDGSASPSATTPSPTTASATSSVSTSAISLPAFRSVQDFPRKPKPDQLPALYVDCLHALQQANNARLILKGRMQGKKQMIAAIRREIDQLEQDVSLEAGTRASLHAMNLRLLKALELMDGVAGDLDQVVQEAHRVPRSRLSRLIGSLQALIQHWRAFKSSQQHALVSPEGSQQDGGRP